MKKAISVLAGVVCILSVNATAVSAQEYYFGMTPASSYSFPGTLPNSYSDGINYNNALNNNSPYDVMQFTQTPEVVDSMQTSPTITNYTQISYDAYLGTVYRTSSQRGDILQCIKEFNLNGIGINRTISELLGALTFQYDGTNSGCAWYKDVANNNAVICTCGNYKIYFDCYASSTGMDIYATISSTTQGIYTFSQSEVLNFFKNLDVQLTNIENSQKDDVNETASSNSTNYNNSVIINGTNSGTIIMNNK